MSTNPDSSADADVDDVLNVEPPVTLSEALGEESGPELSSLPGVGQVFSARLQNQGICDPEQVARFSVEELAEVLRTSEGRAERIRRGARNRRSDGSVS